jgi:hypothetical protein
MTRAKERLLITASGKNEFTAETGLHDNSRLRRRLTSDY